MTWLAVMMLNCQNWMWISKNAIYFSLPFVSFLQMSEPRKVHNMFCFMLDPQYKNLCFMHFFIGLQQGIEVV
jgi:hypothetical protein